MIGVQRMTWFGYIFIIYTYTLLNFTSLYESATYLVSKLSDP